MDDFCGTPQSRNRALLRRPNTTPVPITSAVQIGLLLDCVEDVVSAGCAVDKVRLRPQFQRSRKNAFPRQVAMYLLHIAGGLSLTHIGHLYGRDRRTVAHACAAIEDRRDEPTLDRVISILERAVLAALRHRLSSTGTSCRARCAMEA